MTTNEPRPGHPAGDSAPTPDSEPQYVAEQLPPGVPLYPAYGQSAYDRPSPGPRATDPQAGYGTYPVFPVADPATGGYSGASYSGASYYGGTAQYPYQGYGQNYGQGHAGYPGYPGYHPPQPPTAPSKRKRALMGAGAAVAALALLLSGAAIAESRHSDSTATAQLPTGTGGTGSGSTGSGSGSGSVGGSAGQGVLPGGSAGTGGSAGNGTSTSASVASKKQQIGIVTIVSVLGYQQAESAGTGMILSSDGEVLTNNHVINGATSVTVTVESTGKSYKADVVGTAPTKDVAVLKLRDASGLATANIDETPQAQVGDSVTGVGNAGGTGTLRAASGKITALEQSITATDESGANAEKLTGLYEINAGIVSGDSGGPLYDADGQVIGIDTAASSSNSQTQTAYAIPIDDALSIADQIQSGTETTTVHIGLPAFIGVSVLPTGAGGAGIASVVANGPAAKAGITAGSVITAVGGTSVADAAGLKTALNKYEPGQSVKLTWTDATGATQSGTVTLVAGPAD